MKTLLLTGYDEAFAPLGVLTAPLMREYAERQGFDFICFRDGEGPHPSWWKMYLLPGAFRQGYDRVIWMDADMVLTNPDIVPPGTSGYHCSQDWGRDATEPWMLSNCCFAAFPDCAGMVCWVIDNRKNYSQEFHEQNHMRQAARCEFHHVITVHPPRTFNAVPVEVHPTVRDPWRPGDWAAHLTMVPLAERVRLVDVIRRQAGV